MPTVNGFNGSKQVVSRQLGSEGTNLCEQGPEAIDDRDESERASVMAHSTSPGHCGCVIHIVDRQTGVPTGRHVELDERCADLSDFGPWHQDNTGVYLLTEIARTPVRVYLDAVRAARKYKCAVAATAFAPLTAERDQHMSYGHIGVCIQEIIGIRASWQRGHQLFSTCGLNQYAHSEFAVEAPLMCSARAKEILFCAAEQVVFEHEHFEAGDTIWLNETPCTLMQETGVTNGEPAGLRIEDLHDDEER